MPSFQPRFLYSQPPESSALLTAKAFERELSELLKQSPSVSFLKPLSSDPLQPPVVTDILFHYDTPIGNWMPWARINVLVLITPNAVTPLTSAIRSNSAHMDAILCRTDDEVQAIRSLKLPSTTSVLLWSEWNSWCEQTVSSLFSSRSTLRLPPILSAEECPPISIITLSYNRRKFLDLAFHNLIITDYPKDKIEWVIIEDSDDVSEQASDKILKFARGAAPLSVSYIPLDTKKTIGEKRNEAIRRAQHDIILMMDDDDHYPETSFRRRVAWLTRHPWKPEAVCCTTIACYDLLKGTSAVNIPPFTLATSQRVSEATLTFYKRWWVERSFPEDVNVSEGEGFCAGRESQMLEIPPQQIIVAMSHGKNASSRRIPEATAKPSCFWGFPKEFLIFLHGLAGVQIEEETNGKRSSTSR